MQELDCSEIIYVNRETLELSNSEDPKALEFIHFFLKGQSFLYNQIRKMIGVIIQVFRGELDDQFMLNTLKNNNVNVALAPGDGLLLEKVGYDKYNEIKENKKSPIMLTLVK
jgi:tRNA pseudouridine38-40 synthase